MTGRDSPEKPKGSGADAARAAEKARLAEALRANLARRKAQARGRAATGDEQPNPDKGGD